MDVTMRDIGAFLDPKFVASGSAVAGGSGDGTKVTAATALDLLDRPSGILVIAYEAALAAGKTVTFAVEHTEAAVSTYGSAVEDQAATVAATGAAGGSTERGVVTIKLDASGAKRYRKYAITPEMDATSTDTLRWSAVFVSLKSIVDVT